MRAAACLLLGLALLPSALRAHSRERQRIDTLEATLNERTALLTQEVKDAAEAVARQEEALRERQQHADFLQEKLDGLRTDVDAGIRRVADSIGTTMAPTLKTLEEGLRAHVETRLETRLGELALAQTRSRDEALAPVATRLNALEANFGSQGRAQADQKVELETLRASLGEFRKYLETFAGTVNTRLEGLTQEVAALRAADAEAARQRDATDARVAAVVQAIDQENRKVRQALRQLAGDESGQTYVVQKGDSLYAIARRHDIPLETLEKANPKYAKTGIHPGDEVVIPPK